ncbi:GNAT family N-acetyltransferase [Kineococcus indalonis]|uniref:GNAT family N-acetyltransferase n=1 Tax=Kineococcus indalonis TaxID=2696566 RepID=UPI00141315EE|nr:GNAT family N-acetyltransferase [Kineococcus indalonis]NAZ86274.1 GNAT family N-acetyltransferase [Kineococcus indalonis]
MSAPGTGVPPGSPPDLRTGEVVLTVCGSAAQWDGLLAEVEGSTAFHTWDWLHLQAGAHGWRFAPLVATVDDEPVGVVPLLMTRRGPVSMEAQVPFPYVGPVVPAEHLTGVFRAVDAWARRQRVAFTRLEFAPGVRHAATAARGAGWSIHEDVTQVVDLSHGSVEAFWSSTRSSVRRSLRTAQRRGAVVRASTREEVATWLPAFFEEAYGARGLPSPYAPDVGERVWERYGRRPDVCMLSVSFDGDPGGLSIAFGHGGTLYSWAGGGFREHRQDQAGTALYVHEILWALQNGYQRLDEVGSVDEGVTRFKQAFGAHPEPYAVVTTSHSALWGTVRAGYRGAKRWSSRLRS